MNRDFVEILSERSAAEADFLVLRVDPKTRSTWPCSTRPNRTPEIAPQRAVSSSPAQAV